MNYDLRFAAKARRDEEGRDEIEEPITKYTEGTESTKKKFDKNDLA
ncbi:MAG: hypothetical protein JWO87_2406 [Phycisphaerales bacterium]|nr:hypothetical protein [Phycisphaerales bacterium]